MGELLLKTPRRVAAVEPREGTPQGNADQKAQAPAAGHDFGQRRSLFVGLHEDCTATRPKHASHFEQRPALVGEQVEDAVPGTAVESPIREGHPQHIRAEDRDLPAEPGPMNGASGPPDHPRGPIEGDQAGIRASSGDGDGGDAGPGRQIQHPGRLALGQMSSDPPAALTPGLLSGEPIIERRRHVEEQVTGQRAHLVKGTWQARQMPSVKAPGGLSRYLLTWRLSTKPGTVSTMVWLGVLRG